MKYNIDNYSIEKFENGNLKIDYRKSMFHDDNDAKTKATKVFAQAEYEISENWKSTTVFSFVGEDGFASETGSSFNNVGNPVAQLDYTDEQQKTVTLQGGLKLDWDILKSLKFTSQFNGEFYTYKQYNYVDNLALWLAADPNRDESAYDTNSLNVNTLTRNRDQYFNWNLSNYLTYNKIYLHANKKYTRVSFLFSLCFPKLSW